MIYFSFTLLSLTYPHACRRACYCTVINTYSVHLPLPHSPHSLCSLVSPLKTQKQNAEMKIEWENEMEKKSNIFFNVYFSRRNIETLKIKYQIKCVARTSNFSFVGHWRRFQHPEIFLGILPILVSETIGNLTYTKPAWFLANIGNDCNEDCTCIDLTIFLLIQILGCMRPL